MNVSFYLVSGYFRMCGKGSGKTAIIENVAIILILFVLVILLFPKDDAHDVSDETMAFIYSDVISDEPLQSPCEDCKTFSISSGGDTFTLYPVNTYNLTALVASIREYRDQLSISTHDILFAWDKLAHPMYDEKIEYRQANRFGYWRAPPGVGIPSNYINTHGANTHIISADSSVSDTLFSLESGDIVSISGYLVDVKLPDYTWKTSRSRDDTWDGSCEIIYVTNLRKIV